MRRLASGCTTDAHPLYSLFMRRLSHCIFQWDEADPTALKTAKRVELVRHGFVNPSDQDVISRIGRRELALHCHRATRSTDDIQVLIQQLLDALGGEQGVDTMGVPLFNTSRMMEEWLKAKRHIPCLQDPPGIELYTVTGTMQKGGQLLNTYRCARSSTSLESFHLHLNCFIPGSTASDLHFQAYMVEGLARWNQDRAQAATSVSSNLGTYSRRLRHVANQLSVELLDEPLYPDFSMPNHQLSIILPL
ncbi:hypothetical protein V1264_016643 [Littorina saxatilis]|uniref:Uncharacterized protein n=1 Tax=Littorina saxatilis TaxID=31220 RepID=A0AAN9BGW6_9CAEN